MEFINVWLQYPKVSVYIDKLDDIVNKYNYTYHRTTKMKSVDVKSSTYIDSSKEFNNKYPKLKISDILRIAKHKNIFCVIKKAENTVPGTYVISDLKYEEIAGTIYKKELQKQIKKSLKLKK